MSFVLRSSKRIGLLTLGLLACASPALAQADDAAEVPAKLADYMKARAEVSGFSGAVLVERDGKPLLRQGHGMASIELEVPNAPETRFRLGSITKSFTAMAVMVLEEQGKLKTDDLVSKHIPDAPEAWKDVTIHHLLTHTSGIPSFTGFPDYDKRKRERSSVEDLLGRFRDSPLEFEPGEKFAYSNSGYVLLGAIIGKASGKSYEEFLRTAVLEPLELADTGYDHAETIIPRRALGYGKGPDGKPINADFLDMSIPFAAGAIYSTVDDLARWAHAFDDRKLVSAEAHERIATPFKDGYAYGWFVSERDGRKKINHGGGIDGFLTTLDRYPEEKLVIAVLSNLEGSNPGAIAEDLARIARGESVEPPKERVEIAVAPEVLDQYAGRYRLIGPGLVLTVSRDGDRLMGQPDGQGKAQLFAEAKDRFFLKVVEAEVEFVRDGAGKVTSLLLRQGVREFKGERLEADAADAPAAKP